MDPLPLDTSVVHSPRPVPVFIQESPFSQRKRTPFRAPRPPQAPAKSCPPVSRIFRTPKSPKGPQLVTFKSAEKTQSSKYKSSIGYGASTLFDVATVLRTSCYNSHSNKSYFEQSFDVCEKLGEGSFGEVYSVRSKEDGRMYAVKKSRQQFRGQWDRKRKLAEVEKHERLPQHPNCIQFHKAWEEREKLYIQTELCQMRYVL